MPIFPLVSVRRGMILLALLMSGATVSLLAGCSWLEPYKVPIVQGNVVTREQVAVLKPGMSRIQVREILGTPLLTSVFRDDRWDYVFTLRQQGTEPQARRVTVFFKGDALERYEADALPSESEFASTLAKPRKASVPLLEASPEKLQDFPAPAPKSAEAPLPPLPASYPPLEASSR